MQSTSTAFQRAIRSSGRRRTKINVIESFGTSYLFEDIDILDGTLNVDRNSAIRRSGSIKLGERSLTDVFFRNHFGPFGIEIELYHGIIFPNGSEEYVKLGIFNIEGFEWMEGDGGWPLIEIYDRAKWIQRAPFVYAQDFSGQLAQNVISAIVTEVIPATVNFEAGLANPRLPGGSTFDGDRWEVIQFCVEAMGAEAYFDRNGVLQVAEVKDPTATPEQAVYEFNIGDGFTEMQTAADGTRSVVRRPEGILTGATRSVGRQETYNGVVVYGAAPSSSAGQPYALAYDNDPSSPTYYNGPFGQSVKRIDNQLLTTTAACGDAAVAHLKGALGLARSIDFTAVGNPALDEGDYVLFTFSDGAQEVHLLDSFAYPLGPGEFSGATRTNPTRQTASVGIEKGDTSLDVKPSPPTALAVTSVGTTSVGLKWKPAQPGTSPIKNYAVYVNGLHRKNVPSTATTATITSLLTGTLYKFTVKAVDEAGLESLPSNMVQKKTTGVVAPPPPTPVERTYTKTYTANWSRTYTGGGSAATWHGNDCYQGVVSGGNGNYRSLIGFNDEQIRADLSGATVIECKVRLYFKHWYRNSGGTAVIGTHNYDNRPGSWSGGNVKEDRVRSSGWPKPGARTVNLGTAIGNDLKSGVAKGIALGPAPSSSTLYYGVARGAASGSLTPVLYITYRK